MGKLTAVLVALEHELCLTRFRVPKLDTTVLRARHDPTSVRSERHTEDEVFVSLEHADALAALRAAATHTRVAATLRVESPHSDGLVQRSRHEVLAAWAECDRVYTVLVTLLTLSALHENASGSIPNSHALIQATGSHVAAIGRHGNSGHAIFDRHGEHALVVVKVPKSDCAVSRTRSDVAAVGGKVERVDVLVVTRELVTDLLGRNIPHANDLVLGTGRKEAAIRTEAHTSYVKVALGAGAVILQMAHLLAGVDIEDLSGAVAASRDKATVLAEANAADDALMGQVMNQIHIESAADVGVEDGMPVIALALEVGRELVGLILRKLVANELNLLSSVLKIWRDLCVRVRWWSRSRDVRRAWVRVCRVLLWCCWTTNTRWRSTEARLAAWGGSWLRWLLRGVAIHATRALRLAIGKRVVRRTRRWVQPSRRPLTLHVTWHAGLALLLLRWRSQTWASLTAGHDALKQVCRTMADGRRRRLRGGGVRALSGTPALLELVTKAGDLFLISAKVSRMSREPEPEQEMGELTFASFVYGCYPIDRSSFLSAPSPGSEHALRSPHDVSIADSMKGTDDSSCER